MITDQRTVLQAALASLAKGEDVSLLAMHLGEIEDEAGTILDLLAALRSAGYHSDRAIAEEVLGELVIALEHAQAHIAGAVSDLQQRLDMTP